MYARVRGGGVFLDKWTLVKGNTPRRLYSTTYLYSWGRNSDGQLGHGDTIPRLVPERVQSCPHLQSYSDISCGAVSSIAVASTHQITDTGASSAYCWGDGFYGQTGQMMMNSAGWSSDLGGGDEESTPIPSPVSDPVAGKRILAVASGDFHSLALDADGRVYSWGAGLLGHGNENSDSIPISISALEGSAISAIQSRGDISMALGKDPSLPSEGNAVVFVWGNLRDDQGRGIKCLAPTRVSTIHSVQSIACSRYSFAILGNNGELLKIYGFSNPRQEDAPIKPDCPALLPEELQLKSSDQYTFPPVLSMDITSGLPKGLKSVHLGDGFALLLDHDGRLFHVAFPTDMNKTQVTQIRQDIVAVDIGTWDVIVSAKNGEILQWQLSNRMTSTDVFVQEEAQRVSRWMRWTRWWRRKEEDPIDSLESTENEREVLSDLVLKEPARIIGDLPGAFKVAAGWDHHLLLVKQ